MIPTEPGIYPDLSFDTYRAIDAVNASSLKVMSRGYKHYLYAKQRRWDQSRAQTLGIAVHEGATQPEEFVKNFVRGEKFDRRTKAGKQAAAEFAEKHEGKTVLTPDEWEQADGMVKSLINTPETCAMLHCEGHTELTMVWEDAETGILCKGRTDRCIHSTGEFAPIIPDLKTSRNADPRGFSVDVARFAYDLSMGFYCDGYHTLVPNVPYPKSCFIVVESSEPYDVGLYWIPEEMVQQGRTLYRHYLRKLLEAELEYGRTGIAGGYPLDGKVQVQGWRRQMVEQIELDGLEKMRVA